MNNEKANNRCGLCGKSLVGRRDKRYCDAYCRNTFNNLNKREHEVYIHNINSIIRKNRRILKTLCPEEKATVRKDVLNKKGFDYRHFSG